jgi:hypothetical protein
VSAGANLHTTVPVALKEALDTRCRESGETISEAVQHALVLLLRLPSTTEEDR